MVTNVLPEYIAEQGSNAKIKEHMRFNTFSYKPGKLLLNWSF